MNGELTVDNIVEGRLYRFYIYGRRDPIVGIYKGIFDPGNPAHKLSRNEQISGMKYILIHNMIYPHGGAIDMIESDFIRLITAHHAGGHHRRSHHRRSHHRHSHHRRRSHHRRH